MTENNFKNIGWDAQRIFSMDFSDYFYKLNQQHIEALMQIYPAIDWDKRWNNTEGITLDERQAFAADLLYRLMNPVDCAEQEIDNCLEYPNNVSFLAFSPQNPHTEPDFVPDGYPNQPFFKFGSIIPDFLPDWLADFVENWATEMTGYESDDVLTVINSFPLFASWEDILTSGLPRITMSFSGVGIVQIRFLLVPFGGRAIVTIDVEPNIADILENLFEGNIRSIELERDFSSLPMETDVDHIEEIVLTEDIEHTIYITFLPVLDGDLIPFKYGGGIRSVTLCGEFAFETPPEVICTIETVLEDEIFFETEYVPVTFGTVYTNTVEHIETLETAYDSTPQSIGTEIPTGTPDDSEKFALCAAILGFLQMYAAQKIAMIQSRNFLEVAWDKVTFAATQAFDTATDLLLGLFGWSYGDCAVDTEEAITALSDDTAIEELQCELLGLLDGAAITETLFNDSIDALTLLTGNAQIIACMMSNDNNLQIYLMFLEIYNSKIIQQDMGTALDCECISASYRVKTYDFSLGLNGWRFQYLPNTSTQMGTLVSDGLQGVASGSVNVIGAVIEHTASWRVHGYRVEFSRDGAGLTANDLGRLFFRPNPDSTVSQANLNPGGGNVAGSHIFSCAVLAPSTNYGTGYNQIWINFQCNSPGSENIKVHKIEIWYMDGFAPAGCYATTDDNPCA